MGDKSYFTTFEVSEICEVNPTTVQNWVKEKKLRAYKTPGGHRRIRRSDLVAFMKKFGMPVPSDLEEGGRMVLVVDDEKDICDLLVSAFEAMDSPPQVRVAYGGVEALLFIGERKPDLVILDIMMPGMNGIEVCQKLKESSSTSNIKVVAITGAHDPALRDRILNAGADLFFTKPLDLPEFCARSLKLLNT